MAMEINRNYNSYGTRGMGGNSAVNTAKEKAVKNQESVSQKSENQKITNPKNGNAESTADYAGKLAKLVPSVEFKVGYAFSSAEKGRTLTVNPKLLEKMQNNPEKEKEMKELIKGVETMTRLMDSINAASGWTVVYKHSYIDENGKYSSIAYLRNDFMLNMSEELREERRENEEELIEKIKEKASESEDGVIYLVHEDMQTILEAAKEDNENNRADKKEKPVIGGNLDLQV